MEEDTFVFLMLVLGEGETYWVDSSCFFLSAWSPRSPSRSLWLAGSDTKVAPKVAKLASCFPGLVAKASARWMKSLNVSYCIGSTENTNPLLFLG